MKGQGRDICRKQRAGKRSSVSLGWFHSRQEVRDIGRAALQKWRACASGQIWEGGEGGEGCGDACVSPSKGEADLVAKHLHGVLCEGFKPLNRSDL